MSVMDKYLVVSYDDDQQQWFYDMVLAMDETAAAAYVCFARPYVMAADASLVENLSLDAPAVFDTTVPLAECDNCAEVHPQGKLAIIRDYETRVSADEVAPAGECPTCGALCHLIDVS